MVELYLNFDPRHSLSIFEIRYMIVLEQVYPILIRLLYPSKTGEKNEKRSFSTPYRIWTGHYDYGLGSLPNGFARPDRTPSTAPGARSDRNDCGACTY